jgi:hypothetical protein
MDYQPGRQIIEQAQGALARGDYVLVLAQGLSQPFAIQNAVEEGPFGRFAIPSGYVLIKLDALIGLQATQTIDLAETIDVSALVA